MSPINSSNSPNEIFISLLSKTTDIGIFSDSNLFWLFSILAFIIIYLLLKELTDLRKGLRIALSLLVPIVIDAYLSFGSFTFHAPIINYDYSVTHGVMFLNLIDTIFSYKIFSHFASPILTPFISSAPSTSDSLITYIIIFLFTSIDSILEFFAIALIIHSIITIYEYKTNSKVPYQLPISIAIAAIPVSIYTYFASNPIKETAETIKTLNGLSLFFSNGSMFDMFLIFLLLIFNLTLIVVILLSTIELIMLFYKKIYYSHREIEYIYDLAGIALIYSLSYSFLFFLHSEYKWYLVIPLTFLYDIYRRKSENIIGNVKQRISERENITHIARTTVEQHRNPTFDRYSASKYNDTSKTNLLIALFVLIAIALFLYSILS